MEEPGEELPCANKLAFDTRRQAESAANVAEYQHGSHLTAYLCKYCSLWHLSTRYDNDNEA